MIPIREFMGESNPTFDHGTYELCSKTSGVAFYWLVENRIPGSWIVIIPYNYFGYSSIIPELIINKLGLWIFMGVE